MYITPVLLWCRAHIHDCIACFVADSVGELAQYAELFVENDINGKRYVCIW